MNARDLLPFYALDAVTDEERQFVEAQLAENEELRLELAELQTGVDAITYDVPPIEPTAATKRQLFERIERDLAKMPPTPDTVRSNSAQQTRWNQWYSQFDTWLRTRWRVPAFAVSIAFTLLFCIWAISLRTQLQTANLLLAEAQQDLSTLQEDLQQVERELTTANDVIATLSGDVERLTDEVATLSVANEALQQQLDERTTTLAFYRDPTLTHFEVSGTDLQAEATGLFSIDESVMQAALWVTGLDVLDPDETYQLWYIGDDGVVSGGVFAVEGDGRASVLLDSAEIDPYNAIGISIEPAGGSETPSDLIVMLGSL